MKNLVKSLKLNSFKRLYYFYGKDVVSVERLVEVAKENIVPSGDDFNVYKFDGKDLNLDEFTDVVESCPMFADYKCILVKDFNCEDYPAEYLKGFMSTLENAPKSSIIIFYIIGCDIRTAKNTLTAKNKKLVDYVSKQGQAFEAVQKNLSQTTRDIQEYCNQNACNISYENAQLIANKCLCNSLTLKNELPKLISYANGREITTEMVEDLISNYYDVNAFAFAKAVVSMDGQQAYKLLNELYTLRAEPIAVLSAVASSFLDLYRVKTALNTGRSEHHVCSDFNYRGREFVVRNYVRDARNIKIEHVRECINILKETNLNIVSTSVDGKISLEKAVAKMIDVGHKYR
jgi:DNA polymerase-3 subunit delta